MRLLALTNSVKPALVDDEDYARCRLHNWCVLCREDFKESIMGSVDGISIYLHRFIMRDYTSETIDHIDRDPYNNQKTNLRAATFAQNAQNRKIPFTNTSGYKGVTFRKDKKVKPWAAGIRINYKQIHLGFFNTAIEAANAYNQAAKKHWGEFAYQNEIPSNMLLDK